MNRSFEEWRVKTYMILEDMDQTKQSWNAAVTACADTLREGEHEGSANFQLALLLESNLISP